MKPHKHAECIIAWAQGAEIEGRRDSTFEWELADTPQWYLYMEYRIKPQPKIVKLYSFYDRIERALENEEDVNKTSAQYLYVSSVANQPMIEWTFTDNKLTNVTLIGQ